MSDGYHALKGFEYQATVNLDLMIRHFNQSNEDVLIRPEGKDDLVVIPETGGSEHFFQVKKPKEYANGVLKNEPWSLTEIVKELLLGTVERLRDNHNRQTWILGDEVSADVHELLRFEAKESNTFPIVYLQTLHILAKIRSKIIPRSHDDGRSLNLWKPASISTTAFLIESFRSRLSSTNVSLGKFEKYIREIESIHRILPEILLRITAEVVYGSDEEIRARIENELRKKYKLDWNILKNTLLPCLRNFVSTVSTQFERTINKYEFETEIRNIWPQITMVCAPQSLNETDLRRKDLLEEVLASVDQGALEIIGISGSGKTTLAAEIVEHIDSNGIPVEPIYIAVRSDKSFRDVISGISFSLREFGIDGLLPIVVDYKSSDEKSILDSARFLSAIDIDLLCIIDLVDGQSSNAFSKELAVFIENISGNKFRLIVLGQSSSFHCLSALQKGTLKLPTSINISGFNFEEFLELTSRLSPGFIGGRAELFEIYNSFTANRLTMLYARLANSLASCGSLDVMQSLVLLPASEALQQVDRLKYELLSNSLKQTADKLFCFILPFQKIEASKIFRSDRVEAAIDELVQCGLLRKLDNNYYEFHETTRKGMESLTSVEIKISTHKLLADYYISKEAVVETVYHLDHSSQHDEAKKVAKDAFLSGENCVGLEDFVKINKVFSSFEMVKLLIESSNSISLYMLPRMLASTCDGGAADLMLELLSENPEILNSDYQKVWRITETIQLCDPFKIYELIKIGLAQPIHTDEPDALEYIVQGVRNVNTPIVSPDFKDFFVNQNAEIKIKILPLFLLDKRREILSEVFSFLHSYKELDVTANRHLYVDAIRNLKINDIADIQEFLAAIPVPDNVTSMLISRSPNLGFLESYIWNNRSSIRPLCIEFVKSELGDESASINALRVLLFFQDENALCFFGKNKSDNSILNSLIQFIPVMFPGGIDLGVYREKILNSNIDFKERVSAFSVFWLAGGNIDDIYHLIIEADARTSVGWNIFILMAALLRPSKAAIHVFEDQLAGKSDKLPVEILVAIVSKLGELEGAEVDEFLVRMLDAHERIASASCLSLQIRRSKLALPVLLEKCAENAGSLFGKASLVAAIASYPQDIAEFKDIWSLYPDMEIWRCILISRLSSLSESEWLAKVATDKSKHWQIRRAAILASENLPFEASLEKIYSFILEEKSSFSIDRHPYLLMHIVLVPIILEERQGLLRSYLKGRASFTAFWGDIFQLNAAGEIFPAECDAGVRSANWLYDRLQFHGWPNNNSAQDNILNELHIPILQAAVLRGLRLFGHFHILEGLLLSAESEWMLMRVLSELGKVSNRRQEDIDRYKKIVSEGAQKHSISAKNCLINMGAKGSSISQEDGNSNNEKNDLVVLDYDQILSIISSKVSIDASLLIIGNLSLGEFTKLVIELDPDKDYSSNMTITAPTLKFCESIPSISSSNHNSIDKNKAAREILRPILASKNSFGFDIPWHISLLNGGTGKHNHISRKYFSAFIHALVLSCDNKLLYIELEIRPDLVLPMLGEISDQFGVKRLVDRRVIPYLVAYANSGSDKMLESLCRLASCIDDSKIDDALEKLFLRWVNRFEKNTTVFQHTNNPSLWRAFNSLRAHPRFIKIPNYEDRLMEILRCNLDWYNRDALINALSESYRSYIQIEKILMKSAPFQHFYWDEVDRLSEVAKNIFTVKSE